MGVDPTVSQREIGTGGLVSIVSYSRQYLMIIASTDCETDGSSAALQMSEGLLAAHITSDQLSESCLIYVN